MLKYNISMSQIINAAPPNPELWHVGHAGLQRTVFMKTQKGRSEVRQRSMALSGRQRQVLIMVDGFKRVDEISSFLPEQELVQIVQFLSEHELISLAREESDVRPVDAFNQAGSVYAEGGAAVRVSLACTLIDAAALPDDRHVAQIRALMLGTAQEYLGILATDVQGRVRQADDVAQLLAVLGYWHMALRESKRGKVYVERYFDEIKASFGGAPVPAWPLEIQEIKA